MQRSPDERERVLTGGLATPEVVRVGDTVRRTAGRWTPAVHALLRHLDAVADFAPDADVEWADGPGDLGPGQSVCHRDLGPRSMIWRDGKAVAIVDWDFAGPGDPLDDVAFLAFTSVPMRDDAYCALHRPVCDQKVRILDPLGVPE
jgi:thiamine kinase-like enzyme